MRRAAVLLLLLSLTAAIACADEEIDETLRALRSPRPRDRVHAAVRLAELSAPLDRNRIRVALVQRLDDRNPDVRRQVAMTLIRRADRGAAAGVAARVKKEPRSEVLTPLLLALGDLGGEEHVDLIAHRGLRHPMPSVRGAAVTALGHIGGMKARALVLEVLREPGGADRQWSLRAAAMLALARCGAKEDIGEVHTIYREHSGDQHWFARSAYAHVVTALDPDPLPVLQKLVGDPDRRVQVTAAVGIARTGHDAEILRLLNHLVPSVRAAAASAVAQVEVTRAYPRLRVLARFDPSRAVRWAATLALFRLEDPTADPLVLQGVTAPEPAIWADALAALAARTGERHGRDVNAWRGALLRWRERQ